MRRRGTARIPAIRAAIAPIGALAAIGAAIIIWAGAPAWSDTARVDARPSARPTEPRDVSKLAKEAVEVSPRVALPGRAKLCCGYPLSESMGFALRFYWLAEQDRYDLEFDDVDIYDRNGFFLGAYPSRFVSSLRMEGSGVLADGRVLNVAGRCKYGTGMCYEQLDAGTHPYGRGAGQRALEPFRSVAVDPRLIPIGEPLYVPEFDGVMLPDGTLHDGCVRADDTGGGIKKRKMDFFVITYDNFRWLLLELWDVIWITPHIEAPRCEYLRRDESVY